MIDKPAVDFIQANIQRAKYCRNLRINALSLAFALGSGIAANLFERIDSDVAVFLGWPLAISLAVFLVTAVMLILGIRRVLKPLGMGNGLILFLQFLTITASPTFIAILVVMLTKRGIPAMPEDMPLQVSDCGDRKVEP